MVCLTTLLVLRAIPRVVTERVRGDENCTGFGRRWLWSTWGTEDTHGSRHSGQSVCWSVLQVVELPVEQPDLSVGTVQQFLGLRVSAYTSSFCRCCPSPFAAVVISRLPTAITHQHPRQWIRNLLFLAAVAKLRLATVTFVMSVRPSARMQQLG